MGKADLHIHSSASDGKYSPADIVRKAAQGGLSVIALTDHDTVEGIPEALEEARNYPSLEIIPGIEVSTDYENGEIHILGYYLEYQNIELKKTLKLLQNSRYMRAVQMVERLHTLDIPVEWGRVRELAGTRSIGRPHIAQAMLECKCVSTFREAFEKYIGRGCPAYVEREKLTPKEAVQLIIRYNGLPVLAHPFTAGDVHRVVSMLKKEGLVGIETYYAGYDSTAISQLAELAKYYELIPTGGTDYHGLDQYHDIELGSVAIPPESIAALRAMSKS